jgi:hypothetical protein
VAGSGWRLQTQGPQGAQRAREAAAPLFPPRFHEGNEASINEVIRGTQMGLSIAH